MDCVTFGKEAGDSSHTVITLPVKPHWGKKKVVDTDWSVKQLVRPLQTLPWLSWGCVMDAWTIMSSHCQRTCAFYPPSPLHPPSALAHHETPSIICSVKCINMLVFRWSLARHSKQHCCGSVPAVTPGQAEPSRGYESHPRDVFTVTCILKTNLLMAEEENDDTAADAEPCIH